MSFNIPAIVPIRDDALATRLDDRIDGKTKPRGSLGRLESLARQIGLIRRDLAPRLSPPTVFVFAADHGVADEGVSAYPQDVTWQMVENFLAGGAAINVLARQQGVELRIVDAGVKHDFGRRDGLVDRKIRAGSGNLAVEAAMTARECEQALRAGAELMADAGGEVVGFGEMGIANTTPAAALMHRLTGEPVADCVGAGTGVDAAGLERKARVIGQAMRLHAGAHAPLEMLAAFGGLEIAMMTGAMLGAASRRRILLIDGFIASSALLVAARLAPAILDYCVFCHQSDERGHARMLRSLGARPLLDLGLRLGEGTGCVLAWPLVQAAAAFLCDMASFGDAGVSER
ncbi:nicotinate-nucleotide--dimethylbenzimidazole phosphoribosyltransferase [Castellaniella denitrificans]|uniref:nicotinate-nucleotide--dimethylbenzimidazole phosphoribosyltransferase n=1 Tax=Castellaniella denitrificans TaxID=56119 RepID=UPI001ACC1750|nr:nicotinate-nucleotide--dimethylbenzimidazole phosphoribosyltransferase [Burkholderiales bacterium]